MFRKETPDEKNLFYFFGVPQILHRELRILGYLKKRAPLHSHGKQDIWNSWGVKFGRGK